MQSAGRAGDLYLGDPITKPGQCRYHAYRDSPTPETQDALFAGMRDVYGDVFDLSQIPPAVRREISVETFRLLWEVIARLELPDLEDIPHATVDEAGEGEAQQPSRWRIPHTEITIARVVTGPRAGEWLFSPDTVRRARGFYERVRHLPYQRSVPAGDISRGL